MFRSLIISGAGHFFLFLFMVILSFVAPPSRPMPPAIRVNLMSAPPREAEEPDRTEPAPTPEPVRTPAPPPPEKTPIPEKKIEIEKPKPTPQPRPQHKESKPKKEIVSETKEIVEAVTPTPTPTPRPTPKPTPRRTPREIRTPGPTPTPPPKIVARATPAPTPVAPAATPTPGPTPRTSTPKVPPVMSAGRLQSQGDFMKLGETYTYFALLAIQQNFRPPFQPDQEATARVKFKIMRDGTIRDPEIVKSSGRSDLDQSAIEALEETGRLSPLYEGFNKPFMEVEVEFDFRKQR